MANLLRRSTDQTPLAPPGFQPDPFESLKDLLRWDPRAALDFPMLRQRPSRFLPDFDVKETKTSYVFKADLPGLREEDVDISLMGNRLTISGKREDEQRQEGERCFAYERNSGFFVRTFTLPDSVDADQIRAELNAGVLTVTIPKPSGTQGKKIPLQSSAGSEQPNDTKPANPGERANATQGQ